MSDYSDNTLNTYLDESELRFLFHNEKYKTKYEKNASEIIDNCFNYKKVENKLDGYMELYAPAIMKSNERFFGSKREKELINSVNDIKNFFKLREEVYLDNLYQLEIEK